MVDPHNPTPVTTPSLPLPTAWKDWIRDGLDCLDRRFGKICGMVVDVPVGAPADVKELEYCSALRQTLRSLRSNGSLTARDVQVHLLSRHATRVPLDRIETDILVDLAGGTAYPVHLESGLAEGKPQHRKNTSSLGSLGSLHPMLRDNRAWMESVSSLGADDLDDNESPVDLAAATGDELERPTAVLKTTPLDLVQQTALLLIPELVKLRAETGGRLPPASALVPRREEEEDQEGDLEEQAPHPKPASSTKTSPPSPTMDPDFQVMIEASLLLICEEAGIAYGTALTVDVIREILHAFSEDHWDDETVEGMVRAAAEVEGAAGGPTSPPILDANTFLRALTSDLSRYRAEWATQPSTLLQDVNSNERVSDVGLPPPPVSSFYSFPAMDYAADSYSNYMWAILSWFLFMITFGSYLYDKFSNRLGNQVDCDAALLTAFGCRVFQSVVVWLEIFVKLMGLGLGFIFLITLGNSEFTNRSLGVTATIISMAFIVIVSALAFRYEVDTFLFSTSKVETEESVYYVSFVTGLILLLLQVVQILRTVLPQGLHSRVAELLAPSPVLYETRIKRAAEFKVSRMVRHALSCHHRAASDKVFAPHATVNRRRLTEIQMHGRTATALHKFYDQSLETKTVGSFWWIAKAYWTGNRLAWKEGLWVSPRLLWANLAQWFVICTTLVLHMLCVRAVRGFPDPLTDRLSRSDILTCLNVGVAAAVAAQTAVALNYVPSAISQTFMFRGGVLGSLHCKSFKDYRSSHDSVAHLFGSALWGAQLMGLIVWAAVAGIMLFFLWGFTRRWAIAAVVQLCAFALSITVKNIVLLLLRRNWYVAFYRTKPGAANIMSVILESLFLSLSTGYIISRAVTLICLSFLYVARIDTPFLADGVGGFGLDKFPVAFRTDILLHEAHRHPYMERWAFLYLMKLRHGSKFGSRHGAAWRILLTMALMPWMRKYRVYPVSNGSAGIGGSHDSGVLPPACRLSGEVLSTPYDAEDFRLERERRMQLEEEIHALKLQIARLSGTSHHSLFSV